MLPGVAMAGSSMASIGIREPAGCGVVKDRSQALLEGGTSGHRNYRCPADFILTCCARRTLAD